MTKKHPVSKILKLEPSISDGPRTVRKSLDMLAKFSPSTFVQIVSVKEGGVRGEVYTTYHDGVVLADDGSTAGRNYYVQRNGEDVAYRVLTSESPQA